MQTNQMNENSLHSDTILRTFVETVIPLIKKELSPSKVLIFGSRVRGEASEDSDIDVIIVSDFFKGIKFIKRMAVVLKKFRFSKHVDYICYTQEEFEKNQNASVIVKAASTEGILA